MFCKSFITKIEKTAHLSSWPLVRQYRTRNTVPSTKLQINIVTINKPVDPWALVRDVGAHVIAVDAMREHRFVIQHSVDVQILALSVKTGSKNIPAASEQVCRLPRTTENRQDVIPNMANVLTGHGRALEDETPHPTCTK